ncbi:MAG: VWA domain-containing protein [Lentisphaeria bacterium]|jgi:hypothetical protein
MPFVHPILLSALAFLAVPFILQFLINRRKVVIRWAAYEWMRQAIVVKRKRLKVTELLKLISKLLLILALALFAARPLYRAVRASRTLLVIDTTLSMGTTLEGGQRLDKAVELALRQLREAEGAVAVAAFDGHLNPVLPMGRRHGNAEAALRNLEVAPRAATPRELLQALATAPLAAAADSIIFISDFQREQYRDRELLAEFRERLGRRRQLAFLPVDDRSGLSNLGIESCHLGPEGFWPGRANRLGVRVRNYGTQPVRGLPVTLQLEEKPSDRAMLNLEPGDAKTVWLTLPTPPAPESELRIHVTIPPDLLAADNDWYAVVAPGEPLRVLAVAERDPDDPFPRDQFLRGALAAFLPNGALAYKAVTPVELVNEELAGYDLLLTVGTRFGERDRIGEKIRAYLAGGGALLAFADPAVPTTFAGLGIPQLQPPPKAAAAEPATPDPQRLRGGYLEFMQFGDLNPTLIHFRQRAGIPVPAAEARLAVTGLAAPLMASRSGPGGGRMVLAGFLPLPGHTDFFYNPNFVLVMMQAAWEALGRDVLRGYAGDGDVAIPLAGSGAPTTLYTLRGGRGEQARAELVARGSQTAIRLPPFREAAWCSIYADQERIGGFGYNLTRQDSAVEPAQGADWAPARQAGIVVASGGGAARGAARGEALWLAMSLLLAAAGLEGYAHLWRKR